MDTLIGSLRWIHIVIGFMGLAAFWVPVVTRKGGRAHKQFGKVFALSGYIVGTTAVATTTLRLGAALADGERPTDNVAAFGFLLFLHYLGWVTLALVHHAVQVVRTRRDPAAIRTPVHLMLTVVPPVLSIAVVAYALLYWSPVSIVLLVLSPLGFMIFQDLRKYRASPPAEKMGWFYAHMGAMLGAGVAFHTAFLVFGASRWLDLSILGPFNWVPWVLPGVIGTIGGSAWERHYRRKFGDLPGRDDDASVEVGA